MNNHSNHQNPKPINDTEPNPTGDPLTRATQSLEDTPVPPLPTDLREQVLTQFQQQAHNNRSNHPASPPSSQRSRFMTIPRRFRYSIAAGLVLAATISWQVIPSSRFDPNQALASMVEQVKAVRAMAVSITVTTPQGSDPALAQAIFTDDGRIFQEMRVKTGDDTVTIQHVFDMRAEKMVTLTPAQKTAMVVEMTGAIKDQAPQDYLQQFRDIGPDQAEFVGKDTVDGIDALRYRINLNQMIRGDLWTDAQTKLPIKMVTRTQLSEDTPAVVSTIDNFNWLDEIDESRFSLEIPEGYTVQSMNIGGGTAQDLTVFLKLWSELIEGPLPDTFGPMEINLMYQRIQEQADTLGFEPPEPTGPSAVGDPEPDHRQDIADGLKRQSAYHKQNVETIRRVLGLPETDDLQKAWMAMAELGGRTAIFLTPLVEENDFQWLGAGVDPETAPANTPLCHWKLEAAGQYQVIYADFSTKAVTVDQLP